MADLNQVKLGETTYDIKDSTALHELTAEDIIAALGFTPTSSSSSISPATQTEDGLMSSIDKTKLDGISGGIFVGDSTSTPGENDFI